MADKKEKLRGVPAQLILIDEAYDITEEVHKQHNSMAKPVVEKVEPMPYPTSRIFDGDGERTSFRPENILASKEKLELVAAINQAMSLTSMIEEDWLENFRNVWLCEFTAEMARDRDRFNEIVGIYKEYYDKSEQLDRDYPHGPALRRHGGVTLNHDLPNLFAERNRKEHAKKLRVLFEDRKSKLNYWATTSPTAEKDGKIFGKSDLKSAAQQGLQLHESSMPPCPCGNCKAYR